MKKARSTFLALPRVEFLSKLEFWHRHRGASRHWNRNWLTLYRVARFPSTSSWQRRACRGSPNSSSSILETGSKVPAFYIISNWASDAIACSPPLYGTSCPDTLNHARTTPHNSVYFLLIHRAAANNARLLGPDVPTGLSSFFAGVPWPGSVPRHARGYSDYGRRSMWAGLLLGVRYFSVYVLFLSFIERGTRRSNKSSYRTMYSARGAQSMCGIFMIQNWSTTETEFFFRPILSLQAGYKQSSQPKFKKKIVILPPRLAVRVGYL